MGVKKVIEIDVRTEEGVKNVKTLNKNIEGTEKQTEATKKATDGLLGSLDRMTGGAITAFRGIVSGAKNGVMAMRSLKVAIISTGIGALVVLVGTLVAYFANTQRGADLVSKAFKGIGATVSVLMDRVSGFGEGLALIFSGKYQEGAEKLKASVKGIGEEIKNEANAAYDLEDALHKVEDREIALISVNAKRRAEISKLRLAAEDEAKSDKERAAALKEATELQNKIYEDEISIAKEKARISRENLALGESSRDEIREDAQLQSRVIELESERDRGLMRLTTRMNAFTGGQKEANKATEEAAKAAKKAAEEEAKRLENIEKLRDKFRTEKEDLDAKTLEEKLELDRERAQAELDALVKTESEKREAQIALNTLYDQKEAELREQRRTEKEEQDKKDAEDRKAKAAQELADKRALLAEEIRLEQEKVAQKRWALDQITSVVGAETALGKAALIAKQLINAQEMVMEIKKTIAFSQLAVAKSQVAVAEGTAQTAKVGFPQNIPLLIGYAAQAAGIIMAIKSAVKGVKGASATMSLPAPTTAPNTDRRTPAPSFNLVGNSQANQLAGALNQNDQPIRAYVVSRNMTTQQEMDRNIRNTASVG
jgi:hypothetical protein